jgi:hypothetical protein
MTWPIAARSPDLTPAALHWDFEAAEFFAAPDLTGWEPRSIARL